MGCEDFADQFLIERLGETKVGYCSRKALGLELLGRLLRLGKASAKG